MKLKVSDSLTDPHPIVLDTQLTYSGMAPREDGRCFGLRTRGARVRVSPAALDRALRILDAVFKAAEARGWGVRHVKHERGGAAIVIDRREVEISMLEGLDHLPHVATEKEIEDARRYAYNRIRRTDAAPNGKLTIVFANVGGSRGKMNEGPRWSPESGLDKALDAIAEAAKNLKGQDEKLEKWWEEQEAARKREQEAAKRMQVEKERVEQLMAVVNAWKKADDIREFVEAARRSEAGENPESGAWLEWATKHADASLSEERLLEAARSAAIV